MTPPDTKLNDILAINSTLASSPALNSFAARYGRYCLSKLANVLFASELQRRVSANGVNLVSVSLKPGFVGTDNAISALPAFFQPLMRFLGSTPLQGARAALFAATAEEIDKDQKRYKGKYLNPDGSVALPSVLARNIDLARDLWELTAQAVKNMLGER